MLELSDELRPHLPKDNTFDFLLNISGKVHREVKHRRTVEFEGGGRRYFIKIHRACGWAEIFKDLLQGRLPIVSAETEWRAIERLQSLGVKTASISGKGKRGFSPATMESFVIMDALPEKVSLEELTQQWGELGGRTKFLLRQQLLAKTAVIARTIHQNGLNHRDFYLCHFLVRNRDWTQWQPGDETDLYLIDLHRMQIRTSVPERWLVKDLGGLLFSALDAGITRNDLLRFLKLYRGTNWRESMRREKGFWRKVLENARWMYRKFHGKNPSMVLKWMTADQG